MLSVPVYITTPSTIIPAIARALEIVFEAAPIVLAMHDIVTADKMLNTQNIKN